MVSSTADSHRPVRGARGFVGWASLLLLSACGVEPRPGTLRKAPEESGAGAEVLDTPPPEDSRPHEADTAGDSAEEQDSQDPSDTEEDGPPEPCSDEAVLVGEVCMDRYEAPNRAGALPLVMLTYDEAQSWCEARSKRLCTDAEWLQACEGPTGTAYPYGDAHEPGRCNDEEEWRVYSQEALSAWPYGTAVEGVESLEELYSLIEAAGGGVAVTEVRELYQGEGGGENSGCGGAWGVYDLVGNVEEWTTRSDGGEPSFHGNLKGRYWAESRSCQSNLTSHGDSFRFYEIGFRCCAEPRR